MIYDDKKCSCSCHTTKGVYHVVPCCDQLSEFDYFDEHPEEDPFMPKPTCPECMGAGERLITDDIYGKCYRCNGTGAI